MKISPLLFTADQTTDSEIFLVSGIRTIVKV